MFFWYSYFHKFILGKLTVLLHCVFVWFTGSIQVSGTFHQVFEGRTDNICYWELMSMQGFPSIRCSSNMEFKSLTPCVVAVELRLDK